MQKLAAPTLEICSRCGCFSSSFSSSFPSSSCCSPCCCSLQCKCKYNCTRHSVCPRVCVCVWHTWRIRNIICDALLQLPLSLSHSLSLSLSRLHCCLPSPLGNHLWALSESGSAERGQDSERERERERASRALSGCANCFDI